MHSCLVLHHLHGLPSCDAYFDTLCSIDYTRKDVSGAYNEVVKSFHFRSFLADGGVLYEHLNSIIPALNDCQQFMMKVGAAHSVFSMSL